MRNPHRKIANAYCDLEAASLLMKKAASAFDDPEASSRKVGSLSNQADLQAGKAAWNAAEAAMTTFGGMSAALETGISATWEFIRHARTTPITEEMLANDVAQHTLGLPRSY